jgi:hypothetical protein
VNFLAIAVFYGLSSWGNVAMQDNAANHFDAILNRLHRNPVLTAMLVTSLIIGVTASVAGVASWRANSACIAEKTAPPHVARDLADDAGMGDVMVRQALQADLVLGVGQSGRGGAAPSRKVALTECPCAASSGWRWQRI